MIGIPKLRFRHPIGERIEVLGLAQYTWAAIFGALYLAYRGLWGGFFLVFFVLQPVWAAVCFPLFHAAPMLWPLWLIVYLLGMSAIVTGLVRRSYLRRGWRRLET
ncbi:MAG: hypothetical protein LCH95_17195 [Proteobacteria bacterium]|nr:hypothetical protein [Pseudomonadota bacterium]